MADSKTKYAIGCLVQWYEIELIEEYCRSIAYSCIYYNSAEAGNSKQDIIVNSVLCTNQDLEKKEDSVDLDAIIQRFKKAAEDILSPYCDVIYSITNTRYTVGEYRANFNSEFCTVAEVLIWGEVDMLWPRQGFNALHLLDSVNTSKKWIATFSICKMWDDSWKILEHPKFTDKPFIENDYTNWWSLKYTMNQQEMDTINGEVQEFELSYIDSDYKFNGCGLVISSEVILAGVNIPRAAFFVHEDTAFLKIFSKLLQGTPQYIFKNILIVHNRNHPKKRQFIQGETGNTMNEKRRSNSWYRQANAFSLRNVENLFKPGYKFLNWTDVE